MAKRSAALRLVDEETGELLACPKCAEWERTYKELERKYRGALTQIGNLRADKEAEARTHELWPQAVALWHEWKVATGRTKSRWREDRFWQCEPFLRKDGFVICRWAVWGIAYMPNRKVIAHGHEEVYNDWKLCFRDSDTFERYAKRGYASPEARQQFSLKAQGVGEDDERIDPHKHFEVNG